VGETRGDLLHLLEDLRDAYSGAIEETILTEILANALDSGATVVALTAQPGTLCLTVVDNGSGMTRRELAKYRPGRQHRDSGPGHKLCGRGHQAGPHRVRGSLHRNQARQEPRGHRLAAVVTASGALAVDRPGPAW
jgi:Histidine kinase-, DNA gyrase B-, and HSP90-like ATPase